MSTYAKQTVYIGLFAPTDSDESITDYVITKHTGLTCKTVGEGMLEFETNMHCLYLPVNYFIDKWQPVI